MAEKEPRSGRRTVSNAELRQLAEDLLAAHPAETPTVPTDKVQRLIHELQAHQSELEIQNEELRRAQFDLVYSRDRFSDLYEFAPVGYLTMDQDGKIVEANLTAATMLGIDRRDLLNQPITRFVGPQSQDDLHLHCQAVLPSDTKHVCEVEMRAADETPMTVRLESVAFGEQEGRRCRTALVDITERRTAEQALRELNDSLEQRVANQTQRVRLLAEALAHLGEGVMITGNRSAWPRPRIVFVNEAMCRISGYAAEELVGQSPQILQGSVTDRTVLQQIRADLATGPSSLVEMVNYRKNGTPYDAEVFITPLLDAQGVRTNFVAIHRDVTGRKRAEQTLQQREQWMRAILNTASDAILTIDQRGIITGVNPATERMFGYAQDELIGQSLEMLLPASHSVQGTSSEHGEYLARYLTTSETHVPGSRYELLAQCKDSTRFPVEVTLNKFERLPFFTVIIRDVTERKNAEQALRESEQRFELAIRGSADGIWDWPDLKQESMWWSPRLYRLLGFEPGEVAATLQTLKDRIHPDDIEHTLSAVQSHFAANIRLDVEFRLMRKAGKYRWFRARAAVLRNKRGEPQRMTGCLEDIDTRKRIEESLRREHELSENIIDTAPAIVLVVNSQGRIVRFNRFLEQLTCWKADEVKGKDWFEIFVPPKDRASARKRFKGAIAGQRTHGGIGKLLTKDGWEREIEWYDAPLTNDQGELVGLLCTGQNITERRLLEREILEISTEEQRRIGNDLHDGVCQELTGLGLLAHGLADELSEACDAPPTKAQGFPHLHEVARKLSDGIGRVTQQSRALSHGLIPVDVDAQGLLAALKELVASINSVYPVHCTLAHETPVEVSNNFTATHLYRIAQEAVANALRHSDAQHIRIALGEANNNVVLAVTDDGVGMRHGNRPSGGMGLRIMKYRADIIGGELDIDSYPSGGTTVQCRCAKGHVDAHHS